MKTIWKVISSTHLDDEIKNTNFCSKTIIKIEDFFLCNIFQYEYFQILARII